MLQGKLSFLKRPKALVLTKTSVPARTASMAKGAVEDLTLQDASHQVLGGFPDIIMLVPAGAKILAPFTSVTIHFGSSFICLLKPDLLKPPAHLTGLISPAFSPAAPPSALPRLPGGRTSCFSFYILFLFIFAFNSSICSLTFSSARRSFSSSGSDQG